MDLSKYPVERVFYFVAGIIPGSAALLIFGVSHPNAFQWFFEENFLGYRSKLALAFAVALILGNSITVFLSSILGAIGGAIGGAKGYRLKPLQTEIAAPWRDATWRALVKQDLGARAPEEIPFISQLAYDQRLKFTEFLPEDHRAQATADANLEKLKSDVNDSAWEQWYNHYHHIILQPKDRAFEWHIQNGFNFNLEATSVYVLISTAIVPGIRHWWCILPASIWVLLLTAEIYTVSARLWNRWSTLGDQIVYLSERAK